MIIRKGPEEIDRIARAGALVAATIDHVGRHVEPGITTGELDVVAEDYIVSHDGIPTSKGYGGDKGHVPFPGAICLSLNDVVVHGIPGDHVVHDGDLLTVDVGVTLDGSIADSAYTFTVGAVPASTQRLLDCAQRALVAGIAQARIGNRVGDISNAVQQVVEGDGFSVVRSLVGHGVGRYYHEAPNIPNFGLPGRGPKLAEGMTIAIEPMITAGGPGVHVWRDGWTIATDDGSLSAHFEHTVAITTTGPRVLTPRVGIAREAVGLLE